MSLETYISEFSKYVIAIIMALYTLECFLTFFKKTEDKRKGIYARQIILMFAFHFSSFMVICFETENVSYLIFYAFQQIILYATIMLYKNIYPKTNRLIVNNMCMLLSVSFVILTRLEYTKALKQFVISTGALVVALIIPFFIHNLKFIKNMKWIYAMLGISLLGIMLLLGQTTYGSKISYTIAGVSFQPAEFVKIIFVFFVASALYKSSTFIEVCLTSIIAAMHVIIQVLNKDLGSAVIYFVVYICMLYIASNKFIYMLLGIMGGSFASVIAYQHFSHIRVRVQAFLDPWSYIDSTGYQITQSLFAISSGGPFGLGLYKGTPNSIPFVEDDFIFSAIAEELGIVFAICLILVCVSCFIMFMRISLRIKDKFYQLIAFGLGVSYIFQVFLTIGGGTQFIPLTGVTLPLVSYGGSSILTTLIMFAIIEGIYMVNDDMEQTILASENIKNRDKTYKKSNKPNKKQKNNSKNINHNNKKTNSSYSTSEKYHKNKYYEDEEYEDDEYYEDEEYEDDKYYEDEEYEGDEYYEDEEYEGDEYYEDEEYEDDEYYEEDDYEDNESYEDEEDDMEFLHGFTRPIDSKKINEITSYDENIGEIYYNEEEYEKDKRRK